MKNNKPNNLSVMMSGPPPKRNKPKEKTALKKQVKKGKQGEKKILVTAPVISNQNLKSLISVVALFDDNALDLSFASIYGYLASRGLFTYSADDSNDPMLVVNGLGYLYGALASSIKNSTITVSRAPELFLDLFAALRSKDITFMTYAKASFAWNTTPQFTGFPTINIQTGVWTPTLIAVDNGLYNSPVVIPIVDFSEENYSYFLSKIAALTKTPKMSIVDPTKYKSSLERDVSTYARNYIYNGLMPSMSGGYYKDIESEVGITAPMLSAFAKYGENNREDRVPTKLHAYAGDAALATGWPLHPTFVSYFNKRAPSFKCIDFDWICGYFTQLLALAIPKAILSGKWNVGTQIQCTFQDFRIMLRQALLNIFDTQYMVQFTGPLTFGSGDNGFVPFQVNGHCYGNIAFSTMMVPTLIRENLNALKARALRVTGKNRSKINVLTYFPVLGRYVEDPPAIPQYQRPDGAGVVPIFINTPQDSINLIDGSTGPANYVNLNGTHYQTVMAMWTEAMGELQAFIAPMSSLIGDSGPLGLGALFYTAVVGNNGQISKKKENQAPPVHYLRSPFAKNILNGLPNYDKNGKLEVQAITPAELLTETQQFITSGIPPNSEMQAFLDSIIVPVIRLDPNGNEDQLSLQMYQVESKEGLSSKYEANFNPTGGGVWSRLSKLALLSCTDIGHDSSSEYQRIMDKLCDHNSAGMLSSLLGGLAKSFLPPDAHGIIDTVAEILPF